MVGAGIGYRVGCVWWWMICRRSCSAYSKTMKMHLSSRIISTRLIMFGWDNSEHRAISRQADCDIPVYWITSPSLSGLNLGQDQYNAERQSSRILLFDCKLARLTILACSLVDPSIRAATDEADDIIPVIHFDLADITRGRHFSGIRRF